MPNFHLKYFITKNPFLRKLVFSILSLFLIIPVCLSFSGCGLFYYETKAANGQNTSTFTKNTSGTNSAGNADNSNSSGNTGNASGSSDTSDNNNTTVSSQNNSSGQDLQNDSSGKLYMVSEIIDGDTFSVNGDGRIRMTGINTPEVDQYFYEEAKEALSFMIEKTNVRLEQDISDIDRYGRFLRYVFAGNLFVNLEMVKRGFANVFTMAPDVKYTDELLGAERYARENNLGLWEISAGFIGENIKEDNENINGSGGDEQGAALKTIFVELIYDAPGNDAENLNGEYAGIKNESAYDIDIGGWTVKDSATKIYEFKHYILKSGEKIFLFSGQGTDSKGSFYWNNTKSVWNNDHDTLYLRDRQGLLIEIYNY